MKIKQRVHTKKMKEVVKKQALHHYPLLFLPFKGTRTNRIWRLSSITEPLDFRLLRAGSIFSLDSAKFRRCCLLFFRERAGPYRFLVETREAISGLLHLTTNKYIAGGTSFFGCCRFFWSKGESGRGHFLLGKNLSLSKKFSILQYFKINYYLFTVLGEVELI